MPGHDVPLALFFLVPLALVVPLTLAIQHRELEEEHVQFGMDGLRNVWIVKPGHGTRGQGIKCYDSLRDILSLASRRGGGKKSVVVQKYVEPCLLLEGARKFDIRAWIVVTNWNPLTIWMYEPYFRVCTEEHSLEKKQLANHYRHLCNRCVQATNDEYDDGDDEGGCMWSVETLTEYLNKFGDGAAIWESIRRQIMHISQMCMHSVQDLIDNKAGCFEWFGLDFMVDEAFNVWTLECNISPDMSRGTQVLERLVPSALNDLWAMLLTPKKVAESGGGGWELVFRGKEIKQEVCMAVGCRVQGVGCRVSGVGAALGVFRSDKPSFR
jgi:tubulin monoglycylase TTLL3/8